MIFRTNDPIRDAERWLYAQDKALEEMPTCCACGEHIQEEKAVCYEGQWYCRDCELDAWADIRKHYLVSVDCDG